MVYAQIKNNRIMNTIVVDETTPLELFAANFDYFIRVDDISPQPSIGWQYDGSIFTSPVEQYEF